MTTAGTTMKEVKVGLFVFIAFVLLAVVVFSISDVYTQARSTYPLRVRFQFANGIDAGAPVRVSGVTVGEVHSVHVYRDEATQKMQAELEVRIARNTRLEEDSIAYVNTLGFLGQRYLEIVPGTPGARLLTPGEILIGRDSVSTVRLLESGHRALEQLDRAIASLNEILTDETARESLKGTLANSKEASNQLTQLLRQANDVLGRIRQGEGTLGRLLVRDDLYQDVKDLIQDIKSHPWKLFSRPKEKGR
jgi:phospholipid/cholesterol/gamma-HCH transport system substrate-binding protein